jgi:nucleoside-diphosphate-sugar epimerase
MLSLVPNTQKMSSTIRNVLIAGATGSVGAPILAALSSKPWFNITILTRESSSARFSSDMPVITLSDEYTTEELTVAFQGQDAVISAISTTPITAEEGTTGLAYRLIDAALAAGVKRFIPSEFGANNLDARARKLVPVYDRKGAMLEYLIDACASTSNMYGMTWTSICCGSWLDWALDPKASGNFLGIDVARRTARVWDSGQSRFAVTTSHNTGLAVAKALLLPDETANKQIYLCDFTTSTLAVVQEFEHQTGLKWELDWNDSAPEVKRLREEFDTGDFDAIWGVLSLSFVADIDVGFDFEADAKKELWNSKLGLPEVDLESVVADAIERVRVTPSIPRANTS